MKNRLKHTMSLLLALLVLFSTCSFTINEHICGGESISYAIGVQADTCGMEMTTADYDKTMFEQVPCCDDITSFVQGQDELSSSKEKLISTQQFIKAFVYSFIYILPKEDQEKAVYKPYAPPPLIKDIHVLDETYLI